MVEVKKKGKRTTNNEIISRISKLDIGKSLVVTKKDWEMKTPLGAYVLRRRTGNEYKVETLVDDSGWKVTAI